MNRMHTNFGQRGPQNMPRKGRDLMYLVEMPISKFILGGSEEFSIEFDDMCGDCSGKGYKSFKTCPNCNGTGMIMHVQNSNGIHMQTASPCGACRGRGEMGTENCSTCNGLGRIRIGKNFKVDILPGSRDGDIVRQRGLGGKGINGGPLGDLIVKLRMKMPSPGDLTEEQKGTLVDLFT